MARPTKPADEKAYNALLRNEKRGRTDTPRRCVLCGESVAITGKYFMVFGYPDASRIGLSCGHQKDAVMREIGDLYDLLTRKGGGP